MHLPASADPEAFLGFVRERAAPVYERLLEVNAMLLNHIAGACGGSARLMFMGLAARKNMDNNILTRMMGHMYEHQPARKTLVAGGLGADVDAFIDATAFCNHPMVYVVPGFHPTSIENIMSNDLAVACFMSFAFGWMMRPNMGRRAFERDPLFSAALEIAKAEHLRRISSLGGKAQAASGMLAEKGKVGREAMAAKRAGMMKVPTGVRNRANGKFEVFKRSASALSPRSRRGGARWNEKAPEWIYTVAKRA